MPDSLRPKIALLVAAESSPSVLYGLYDVLFTVGPVFGEMVGGAVADPLLDVKIVSADGAPLRCMGDIPVIPHLSADDESPVDVAIVCDMYTPIDTPPHGRYNREVAWLKRQHEQGAILASVCTGSLVLAETGLLDGFDASSHWAYCDLFREHYPKVRLREDAIITQSGQDQRIITAAAVTAWHDLVLYLIARLVGSEHAIQTAKVFLLSSHDDGQLPFAAMAQRVQKTDAIINECQVWLADNYACTNPVAQMSERSGLTPRTFSRRFKAATGLQPLDYVHALRIEEAKQLLETESSIVDEIGREIGYDDPAFFRRLFKRKAGLTPAAYRRKFARMIAAA